MRQRLKQRVFLFSIAVTLFIGNSTFAEIQKEPYRHILSLGADSSISNGDDSITPLIAYYYFMENFDNPNLYGRLAVKTTDTYYRFGWRNEKIITGIQPTFSYICYGAYAAYDRGRSDETRRFYGNSLGVLLLGQYFLSPYLASLVSWRPDYYFYFKKSDTTIDLPHKHWENQLAADITFNNVEEKNIGRVKNGILAKFRYEHIFRNGYGTFRDTAAVADSSTDNTDRLYMTLGMYYSFPDDYTVLAECRAGLHHNVDRNNAEKIGFFDADHAIVPGYYYGEFYHDRYMVLSTGAGIPVSFWDSRIQPGFYMLLMPHKNRVVGEPDYPRRMYRSVACEFSTKVANTLPVFLCYGYGIDAQRKGERGSHEVRGYFMAAFGENDTPEDK